MPEETGKNGQSTGGEGIQDDAYKAPLLAIAQFFREHPAIAGSLIYVQITVIGIAYSWAFYGQYEINIFDFAETNDFLLAAFKEPFAFVMTIITMLLFICMAYFSVRRRSYRQGNRHNTTYITISATVVVLVLYTIGVPYFYATFLTESTQELQSVEVQYRTTSESAEQPRVLRLIGGTEKFTFFYDENRQNTLLIPHAQVVYIEFLE